MQQKYELWTRLTYFWHKNEKKISLNFIFCIRNPTFSTYMSQLFIVKICFTNEINIISGGGQLLVSESQGSISRVPSVRFFVGSLKLQGPSSRVPESQVPGSQVSGSQVRGFRVSGPRYQSSWVWCIRVPGFQVSVSWNSGSQGPGSRVLILDYALLNNFEYKLLLWALCSRRCVISS